MIINKTQLYISLLALQIVMIVLFVFRIDLFQLRTILSFLFLIFVPGFLMLQCLRIDKIGFYEKLSYVIGLSLSFLIFFGLFINTLFPLFGIIHPLTATILQIGIISTLSVLGFFAYIRSKQFTLTIKIPSISKSNKILFISPFILLVGSILGTNILNNNGSSVTASLTIIGIALYIFIVIALRKKINENIFPPIIFLLSLSLLLSYSLRSWHILGWDINQEFQMYQLTKAIQLWSPDNSVSSFNSCLSITILPTIFHSFFNINDEYLFKVIYQLLFAIVPLNVYLIVKRYSNSLFAFFSSFLFMAQGLFYMGLSAITRQEIAFIFFSCSTLVLLNKNLKPAIKNGLFLIFGFSMIVSHYSTTYITLILLILTYLITILLKYVFKLKSSQLLKNVNIKLIPLVILVVATIFWNIIVVRSTNNVSYTIGAMVRELGQTFSSESKNATIFSFLLNKNHIYSNEQLNKFISTRVSEYSRLHQDELIMKGVTDNTYNLHFVTDRYITTGRTIINQISLIPYTIAKYVVMLGLAIGLFVIYFDIRKKGSIFDLEYLLLSTSPVILIILAIVLPHISVAYNVDRIFLQGLTFLSICIVVGIATLFKPFKSLKFYLIGLIIVIYYLYQSGLTASLTGNIPRVNTFNRGMEYDAHYIHAEDISAITWMANRYQNYEYIYMDTMAIPKFKAFAGRNINHIQYVIPNIINKTYYVYASYSNTHQNVAFIEDSIYSTGSLLFTNYPFEFLNDNKNLIYNNGSARFYK